MHDEGGHSSFALVRNLFCFSFAAARVQELRFIFPALPLFNLAAGVGMWRALEGVLGKDRGGQQKKKDEDSEGRGNR